MEYTKDDKFKEIYPVPLNPENGTEEEWIEKNREEI